MSILFMTKAEKGWREGVLTLLFWIPTIYIRAMMIRLFFAFALYAALGLLPARAADDPQVLPVPRFVTLAADEVNLRTGPGIRYPIRLVIRKEGLPVEIIREFDVWRQVRDYEGDEGWVHKSMLSGRRAVMIRGQVQTLLKNREPAASPVVKLEPGVLGALEKCRGDWCQLKVASYSGWLNRANIWGVYPHENFGE